MSTLTAGIRETQSDRNQEGGKGRQLAESTVSWVGTHVRGERTINPRLRGCSEASMRHFRISDGMCHESARIKTKHKHGGYLSDHLPQCWFGTQTLFIFKNNSRVHEPVEIKQRKRLFLFSMISCVAQGFFIAK